MTGFCSCFAQYRQTMLRYLDAFNKGDPNTILALFSDNALVHSPTQHEPKNPRDFFPSLLERSKGTVFAVKSLFAGEKLDQAAILFDYTKPLPDGRTVTFDCTDIFTFDTEGKIKEMRIIFDTKKLG